MKKKSLLFLFSSLILASCTDVNIVTSFSNNNSSSFTSSNVSTNDILSEDISTGESSSSSSFSSFSSSSNVSLSTTSSRSSSSNSSSSKEEINEILKNADLNALDTWTIFSDAGCVLKATSHGNYSIALEVNNASSNDNWNPQFLQSGLNLLANETYHISFTIKSSVSRKINFLLQTTDYQDSPVNEIISLTQNEAYSFEKDITLTRETTYLYGFMLGKIEGEICTTNHQIEISHPSLRGLSKVEDKSKPLDGTFDSAPTTKNGYQLKWNDEFNGSSLDSSKWDYEIGTGEWGWGNNEMQYYTNRSENLYINNGSMKIVARKENYQGKEYTSSRIITKNKYEFHYGYIEARMALPSSLGIWPAFWLLGENIDSVSWPECGEIDVMEAINNEEKVHATLHWNDNGHQSSSNNGSEMKTRPQYHIYAMEWNEQSIKIYVDDNLTFEKTNIPNAFKKDFYFLFNVAVGGQWPGYNIDNSNFPLYMSVDYLRVYQ